ncbi:SDR family NAD(P)-dependent oxidoreductase [Rhodopila sp.]|jgi:NAD(P)-dependent dehydrogenase (short-subunit alcohol dehydrogenase family)|uniref:SDR family NAD(P)-dependent oxidoreductase n=1 Tax=Rhodopila sp. TaxID=2480087 RepID=UPI002B68B947|nr:SDR family oxidoreductase [Rhodopila sp.]HVZ09296.1 SDR family oxidoreductase [Rhodopila sp.]
MSENQPILLLTGASRGIGHATVKRFGSAGWRVLTISRQPFDPRCPWPDAEPNHIQLDLADVEAVRDTVPRIREICGGRLNALVNNAAISPKHPDGAKITSLQMAYADWLHIFNVNFFSAVLLTQGLADLLVDSKGSIVNMTSIVGSRVHPFASAAYATSKAALAALTREMANDLGRYGVRVNAVSPGEIDTAILSPGTEEIVQREIPMRRLGKPSEVADLLFFLCSDQALYLSGSEVHIDGGQRV